MHAATGALKHNRVPIIKLIEAIEEGPKVRSAGGQPQIELDDTWSFLYIELALDSLTAGLILLRFAISMMVQDVF